MVHIPIPLGVRYRAVARNSLLKQVTCENCQAHYAYVLEIEARGSELDLLFLNSAEAKAMAVAQARENLAAKTRNSIVTLPCPKCGFYQADMVRQLKENAWTNPTQFLGAVVVLAAFTPLAFGIPDAWLVTAIAAAVGGAILVYGYVLSARYDPNAGDATARIELARQNTLWGEQLDQLLKKHAERMAAGEDAPAE